MCKNHICGMGLRRNPMPHMEVGTPCRIGTPYLHRKGVPMQTWGSYAGIGTPCCIWVSLQAEEPMKEPHAAYESVWKCSSLSESLVKSKGLSSYPGKLAWPK